MTHPPRRAPLLAAAVCAAALGWADVLAADGAAGQGTVAFVGGIEDLPLMPGLEEDAAGRMVFDTAAGRPGATSSCATRFPNACVTMISHFKC